MKDLMKKKWKILVDHSVVGMIAVEDDVDGNENDKRW